MLISPNRNVRSNLSGAAIDSLAFDAPFAARKFASGKVGGVLCLMSFFKGAGF
jgi:hypothetical protein